MSLHSTVFCAAANRLLDESPGMCASLAPFAGQHVQAGWGLLRIDWTIGADGRLQAWTGEQDNAAAAPDLRLTLEPTRLPLLLTASDRRNALRELFHAEGNLDLGAAIDRLLPLLPWAFEAALARVLGPVFAHRLVETAWRLAGWPAEAVEAVTRATAAYARDEAGLLPAAGDVGRFVADVDELRDAAERLDARLRLLERVAASPTAGEPAALAH